MARRNLAIPLLSLSLLVTVAFPALSDDAASVLHEPWERLHQERRNHPKPIAVPEADATLLLALGLGATTAVAWRVKRTA